MPNQSKIFLKTEGDKYYLRNKIRKYNLKSDIPLKELTRLIKKYENKKRVNILEIGCGDGWRLSELKKKFNCNCFGVEPSKLAIKNKINKKIIIKRGTAEKLDFSDNKFDIIFFGFCLYVVDWNDLIKIVSETNRVLKKSGWILILDFYSSKIIKKNYKHDKRIKSTKYNFINIFTWHPYFHQKKIKTFNYLNKKNFKVSVSIIKKNEK